MGSKAITQFWGSGVGGKFFLVDKLLARLPAHTRYIEPFVGAGSVFWGKNPAEREWISDADTQVARAYYDIKVMRSDDFDRLERMDWTPDPTRFQQFRLDIVAAPLQDPTESLFRFLYLKRHSFQRQMKQFAPNVVPPRDFFPRLRLAHRRLRNVHVAASDVLPALADHAAYETAFAYLDPPYPGTGQKLRNRDLLYNYDDLQRLSDFLKDHWQGLFMMSVANTPPTREILSPFLIEEVTTRRTAGLWRKEGAIKEGIELIVSNYEIG